MVAGASTTPVMRRPLSPGTTSQLPEEGGVTAGHITVVLWVGTQVFSQPSPLLRLPSSHSSVPSLTPLPQDTPGVTVQSGSQPSPATVLPSSQSSVPARLPSPQVLAGVMVQSASQPSPATSLPAS